MHGGGRRFKPCQLHKNFSFLLFEIVSFCSFNKNTRAFLLEQVVLIKIITIIFIKIISINKNTLICKLCNKGFNQVIKGVRRMPWHLKAMKDVVSCDKPRLGANNH